jgi:hypothetical protein
MKHITKNKKFLISTTNAFGTCWETLVFAYGSDNEISWQELDGTKYASQKEAENGHLNYVSKWENKD